MLHGLKLDILNKHSSLLNKAKEGKDSFPGELSNFLVIEFDFKEVLIFDIQDSGKLYLLGKSSYAGEEFTEGNYYDCKVCEDTSSVSYINLNSDFNCNEKLSDSPSFECCVLFKTGTGKNILMKLTRKVHFTEIDNDALKGIAGIVSNYLELWFSARNNISFLSGKHFSKVLEKSLDNLISRLNTVLGNSSIVLNTELQSNQQNYISEIKSITRILLNEVNHLKTLNRIESAGASKNEITGIELKNLLTEALSNLGLEISVNTSNENLKINSDEPKLKHLIKSILTFLAENEIRISKIIASENNGNIDLDFRLHTVDNPKILQYLLNPYSLLDTDNGSVKSNIPMYLLSNKYLKEISSELKIKKDEYSGYSILLSVKNLSGDEKVKEAKEVSKNDERKVLVIGNDYATSTLLNKYLEKWNYKPVSVNSPSEIFRKLNDDNFLAIILDVEQKDENSVELLRKIKKHEKAKTLPVIVCSVEPENEEAVVLGAIEYLTKPINYNNLVEILTSYKLSKDSNVLCVDDDIPTLNLVKQAIETAGFNAIAEFRSDKVMDLISDMNLDLAIIDLDMPKLNGYELIKLIKSESKFSELPIIIYTGKEDYQEELKNVEGLFNHLLSKKTTGIKDLETAIKNMIDRTAPPAESKVGDSGVKILLAEDYKHSQIIVTRLLKRNNFKNVVVVENGQEALDYVQKEKVDLILMDMQMPVMNGFEAIERIREIPEYRETPIISITAFAMKGDREKCLEAGATDYLPKPLDSKEFIEKIKYYTKTAAG